MRGAHRRDRRCRLARAPSPPLLGTEPALEVVAKAGDGCDGLSQALNRLQVVVDGPGDRWIGPPRVVRTSTLPARPARVGAPSPTRTAARTHRPSTWCRLTRADAPSAPQSPSRLYPTRHRGAGARGSEPAEGPRGGRCGERWSFPPTPHRPGRAVLAEVTRRTGTCSWSGAAVSATGLLITCRDPRIRFRQRLVPRRAQRPVRVGERWCLEHGLDAARLPPWLCRKPLSVASHDCLQRDSSDVFSRSSRAVCRPSPNRLRPTRQLAVTANTSVPRRRPRPDGAPR